MQFGLCADATLCFQPPFPSYFQCDLAMISPNRVVVAGPTQRICVYDIPPESQLVATDVHDRSALPLYPTWIWKGEDSSIPRHPACTLPSYSIASGAPVCCIIDYSTVVHLLYLSAEGEPIRKHRIFPVKFAFPFWMGHSRGIFVNENDVKDFVKITTVPFDDPMTTGSIEIVFEDDLRFTDDIIPSFDEETGRVLVVTKNQTGGYVFLVYDTV